MLAGPDPGQRGGRKGRARGRPLCVPEKALRHLRSGWSQTQPYRLQDQLHSLEQKVGVENRGKQMERKLEMQFFLRGIPAKCAEIAKLPVLFPAPPKEE